MVRSQTYKTRVLMFMSLVLAVVLFFSFPFPASAAPVEESAADGISFPTNTIFFPSDSDYVYISDSAPLKFKKRHYGHYLFACTFQAGGTFVGNTSGYCFQGNFYIECNGIRYYFYPSFNGDGVTYLEFALDLFDQNTVSVGYEGYVVRTVVNSPTAYFTYKMNLMFTYTLYQEGQTPIQYLAGIDGHLVDINNTIVSGVNNLYNMGGAIAGKLDGLNNTVDMGLGTVNSSILKSGSDIVSALSGLTSIGSGVSGVKGSLDSFSNQTHKDFTDLGGTISEGLGAVKESIDDGNQLQQEGNLLQQEGNQLQQENNQLEQKQNELLEEGNHLQEEQNETNKGILATLREFFGGFFDNLGKTVMSWIVPTSEQLTEFLNEVNAWFSDRLGFIWYPFSLAIDMVAALAGGSADQTFRVPALSLNILGDSYTIWGDIDVDLDAFGIFVYVRIFTSFILVSGIVRMAIDKWDEWIGGHNA